jgi:hypothetical protein
LIEQTRRHINRLVEEIAALSKQDLSPADYFNEYLQRVQRALASTAGAVWMFTPQGHLQIQFQINMRQVGIDSTDSNRERHAELLRQVVAKGQPLIMHPHSGVQGNDSASGAGNPTDYVILLVPVIIEKAVQGLIEIFQDPARNPAAQAGYLQFLVHVAELAGGFLRNSRLRQISGQQQLWTQLEAFARNVHISLNPIEVAYQVANEGNRLIGSDRLSVAQRYGKKTVVQAISGADIVEKRSNLVQLQRALFDAVIEWKEKLIYTGTRDDSLPPDVLKALDAYHSESHSKVLIVTPLRDEREKESDWPSRSALMMECFEPNQSPDQLLSKLEVVGKHAAPALYNALEHRRIPMRFIWLPLAKVQEGLGGKTQAIIYSVLVALTLLIIAMVTVPYPLKMDSKGQLLPQNRYWIFPPYEGHVERFLVEPNMEVAQDQPLVEMHDLQLAIKLQEVQSQIYASEAKMKNAMVRMNDQGLTDGDRKQASIEKSQEEQTKALYTEQYNRLRGRVNAESLQPGYFYVKSPITGMVLNYDFKENLSNKMLKPSDQMLRIGETGGPWEVELKVPQKHIGQILMAFDPKKPGHELDVDILLSSAPTRVFKGKLSRDKIAGEAIPNRDDNNESEPVVLATVRIDGDDIPAADRVPHDLLLTGTEVHAKVRCGNHRLGYSLFYGVWEFFYEKVVFFF